MATVLGVQEGPGRPLTQTLVEYLKSKKLLVVLDNCEHLLPACAAGVFLLYYIGYEGLHYLMHKPTFPWIERSRYFKFLERHHRIHHFQMARNLNVLVPVADFLLGSLVTEAAEPAGTREGAKKLARRHSQFGRRMRGEIHRGRSVRVAENGSKDVPAEAGEPAESLRVGAERRSG